MRSRAVALSVILALALLAAPVPSHGQQPGKVYRIGWLGTSSGGGETDTHHCPIQGLDSWQAGLEGLREHRYTPGQNLLIECRWTEGQGDWRTYALAVELVGLKPDLVVAIGGNARAVKRATRTIPIVMVGTLDPVGLLVESLARPGGNLTGLTYTVGVEIFGKQLQLLKEAVPPVSRVAVLRYAGGPPDPLFAKERETAARALGLTLLFYEVRDPAEFAGAFAAMTKARAEALFVVADMFWQGHEQRLVALAGQSRLPAIYNTRDFVPAGGLMAYDVNRPDIFRRLGYCVDKIFHGVKPADIPVEQPTKFDLLINLKAAKAIGLTIPQSLLNRADEVIQ